MGRTWIKRGAFAVVALLALGFAVGSLGGTAPLGAPLSPANLSARDEGVDQHGTLRRGLSARAGAPVSLEDSTRESVKTTDAAPPSSLPLGDRIIRTGELAVEVDEGTFDAAWRAALQVARKLGGSVLTSSTAILTDDRVPSGEITIRVPTDRFEQALIELRDIGEVRADQTSSQDVTEEYIDLTSRARHLRAQETVMLRLMARARTIQDTITVQQQLSEIQLEIERIVGRLNYLDAHTEFSTVTLRLAEPGGFLGAAPPSDEPSFRRAWDTALTGLKRMATAGMIAGLWLAPFAILAAVGAWAFGRGRRTMPVIEEPAPQA